MRVLPLLFKVIYAYYIGFVSAGEWAYTGKHGTGHWFEDYERCAGTRQSPINIDTEDIVKVKMGDISLQNYRDLHDLDIENNGHTLLINVPKNKKNIPNIRGGPLNETMQLLQFHFHWGAKVERGSEHQIDSDRFSLEMHAVHSNGKKGKHKRLAVIAYIFDVEEKIDTWETNHDVKSDNYRDVLGHLLSKIAIESVKDLKTDKHQIIENIVDLFDYSIDEESSDDHHGVLQHYCTYMGSLTTPPCSEIVTWIIDNKIRKIPFQLVDNLRRIKAKGGKPIVDNFREVQPRLGRTIRCNSEHYML